LWSCGLVVLFAVCLIREGVMTGVLLLAQVDWVGLVRALFSGIEALGIVVLLVLLIVGWAKIATGTKGSTP